MARAGQRVLGGEIGHDELICHDDPVGEYLVSSILLQGTLTTLGVDRASAMNQVGLTSKGFIQ